MQYPRISIVTPSYNDVSHLESTILSVINQQYPNLEYIVIDGGSTDGSVDIIKKYENSLSYWISEKDQGMYYAIQKGFEKSTGDVMGWINSDDMLHPGSLFTLGQIFVDFEQVSWIHGYPNTIDERGRSAVVYLWPELSKLYFYKQRRARNKYFQQESTFWHRRLWEKAGSHVSVNYKLAGDFELWTRFFQHEKLFYLNALLGSFRASRSGQASVENFEVYIDETYRILASYPLTRAEKRKIRLMNFFELFETRITSLMAWMKRRLHLNDPSVSTDLRFDRKEQKFKLK